MSKAEVKIETRRDRIFFLSILVFKCRLSLKSIVPPFFFEENLTGEGEKTIIFPDVAEKH